MSKQKFAVFDIDGTVIRWQLYHAIVDDLAKKGLISSSDYDNIKKARMIWKQRSDSDSYAPYELTVARTFIKASTTIPIDAFNKSVDGVFEEYKDQVYTYTRDLIYELKSKDYFLLTISGSHHEIISKLAKYYGFDDYVGNQYLIEDGKFTGKSTGTIDKKDALLQEFVSKHNLTYEGSIGVGDSASDIPMLNIVENPIAFNPTRDLYNVAIKNSWKVIVERKNVVYTLPAHQHEQ